jgi:hypothetical protein
MSRRELAKHKAETTGPGLEVLDRVYALLTATPELMLADGSKAQVKAFVPPFRDDDGEVRCCFDVQFENGSHLEFMVHNTGWGKFMADAVARRKSEQGRFR